MTKRQAKRSKIDRDFDRWVSPATVAKERQQRTEAVRSVAASLPAKRATTRRAAPPTTP